MGRDGCQVVSVLAFYSDDPSSNPFSKMCVWKERKWIKRGRVGPFFKEYLFWRLPLLLGIICAYHPAAMGSNPKHTIYAFFNWYYWNCNEKRTKIKEKEVGIGPFLKYEYLFHKQKYHWTADLFFVQSLSLKIDRTFPTQSFIFSP